MSIKSVYNATQYVNCSPQQGLQCINMVHTVSALSPLPPTTYKDHRVCIGSTQHLYSPPSTQWMTRTAVYPRGPHSTWTIYPQLCMTRTIVHTWGPYRLFTTLPPPTTVCDTDCSAQMWPFTLIPFSILHQLTCKPWYNTFCKCRFSTFVHLQLLPMYVST